jgi:hypothetical protein
MIKTANEERPPGVDTAVITRVSGERQAVVDAKASLAAEAGKGVQQRAALKDQIKSIVARRKRIQYTADRIWAPGKAESAEARKAFKLPADRRYSY